MTRSSLGTLTVCGLGAVLLVATGCGSTKITPGGPREFVPQTGSNIGRRLPPSSVRAAERAPKPTAKAKREKAKKEARRERTADDYMPRGGFR